MDKTRNLRNELMNRIYSKAVRSKDVFLNIINVISPESIGGTLLITRGTGAHAHARGRLSYPCRVFAKYPSFGTSLNSLLSLSFFSQLGDGLEELPFCTRPRWGDKPLLLGETQLKVHTSTFSSLLTHFSRRLNSSRFRDAPEQSRDNKEMERIEDKST